MSPTISNVTVTVLAYYKGTWNMLTVVEKRGNRKVLNIPFGLNVSNSRRTSALIALSDRTALLPFVKSQKELENIFGNLTSKDYVDCMDVNTRTWTRSYFVCLKCKKVDTFKLRNEIKKRVSTNAPTMLNVNSILNTVDIKYVKARSVLKGKMTHGGKTFRNCCQNLLRNEKYRNMLDMKTKNSL